MALLTPLSLERARSLGARYGLEVRSIRPIQAGSVNSNFEIVTDRGRRFLRIYEEQTAETAAREAALLSHLAHAGVPTPEPIHRADGRGFIVDEAGKPAAIFPFREGEMICQRGVTEAKARAVGDALAAIHRAGQALAPGRLSELAGETRFGDAALLERVARIAGLTTSDEILAVTASVRSYLEAPRAAPRAIGLIHGDVFRDNVLWSGDAIVAVLDFESASIGSLAFDVMVTTLAWCFGDDLDGRLASALFAGYVAGGGPGNALRDELHDAGLFACARFTTTRLTDFELRPRGTTVYKDFRRWHRRGERLRALGSAGLLALMDVDRALGGG